jgi:hypothetical protein
VGHVNEENASALASERPAHERAIELRTRPGCMSVDVSE